MKEIKYPTQTTYFIAYTNDRVCVYGVVEPEQDMVTGQPNLYQTTDMVQWLLELEKFHVVWGYKYSDEKNANFEKQQLQNKNSEIGDGIVIHESKNNNPKFWYIIEDYLGQLDKYLGSLQSFIVLPD